MASSTVSCPAGNFALSGGYVLLSYTLGSPLVTRSVGGSSPPTDWTTPIFGTTGEGVQTAVNCFDNSP